MLVLDHTPTAAGSTDGGDLDSNDKNRIILLNCGQTDEGFFLVSLTSRSLGAAGSLGSLGRFQHAFSLTRSLGAAGSLGSLGRFQHSNAAQSIVIILGGSGHCKHGNKGDEKGNKLHGCWFALLWFGLLWLVLESLLLWIERFVSYAKLWTKLWTKLWIQSCEILDSAIISVTSVLMEHVPKPA